MYTKSIYLIHEKYIPDTQKVFMRTKLGHFCYSQVANF